jgi:hypothetical protein
MPKVRLPEVTSCKFVAATSLVPRGWDKWFWPEISENAPFSWGDNDHSLVNAQDFADHCERVLRRDRSWKIKRFLRRVRALKVYIDLET